MDPTPLFPPQRHMIELLEDALQEVREGRVIGVTLIMSLQGETVFRTSATDKIKHLGAMTYEIHRLSRMIQESK